MLETIEELHILQPGSAIHVSPVRRSVSFVPGAR